MKIHISPVLALILVEIGHDVTGGNNFRQGKVNAVRLGGPNGLSHKNN